MVAPKDKTALAVGLESLFAMSAAERRKLGEQARRRIEDNFTLGTIVDRYATLYKTIIFEKRES